MQLSYLNQIITVNYSWTLCFFNLFHLLLLFNYNSSEFVLQGV